jgi:hypothetical protein
MTWTKTGHEEAFARKRTTSARLSAPPHLRLSVLDGTETREHRASIRRDAAAPRRCSNEESINVAFAAIPKKQMSPKN